MSLHCLERGGPGARFALRQGPPCCFKQFSGRNRLRLIHFGRQRAVLEIAMKILLPVDGSYCSLAAAGEVASRPWPPGSVVRLVHVSEEPGQTEDVNPARIGRPFPAPPYAIEKGLGRLSGVRPSLAVEARVLHGRPKVAILDEAETWEADLIVLGAHGTSGVERFLMGSVSTVVAARAKCSVEIVRPRDKREQV